MTPQTLQHELNRIAQGDLSQVYLTYLSRDRKLQDLTYKKVLDRIARLGSLYAGWGLSPGDRVLLASRDDGAVSTLVLSCLYHGFSAVVVDPASSADEAEHFLTLASPAAAIVDCNLLTTWPLDQLPRSLAIAETGGGGGLFWQLLGRRDRSAKAGSEATQYPALLEGLPPSEPPSEMADHNEAYILFTSGSTSRPKGVRISRAALGEHARTFARHYGYGRDCRLMNLLPLHHTDGLFHGLLTAWLSGATSLRPMRFSVAEIEAFFDSIYTLRTTHLITVPTMLNLLERFADGYEEAFQTEDFRFIISSASPLEETLWTNFQTRFGVRVANLYGLTETVCGGLFCGPDEQTFRLGTVGRPVDCRVRLVDEDDHDVRPGEPGKLLIAGSLLMMGYVNDDQATGDAMRGEWFTTGDIARVDADGFYRIMGREKQLVVTGGINVQPAEVTGALLRVPGIREAVTFGVADEVFGEVLAACVVLDQGCPLDSAAIIDHCRGLLAPEKIPKTVALVPGLPCTPSGKVSLPLVRELYDQLAATRPVLSSDLDDQVLDLAAQAFRVPRNELQAGMGAQEIPEWDSFAHLAFVVQLESHFGVRLTPAEIMALRTLRDAQNLVRDKTSR